MWQERCQSSRFHTDSQQRYFVLILFYFKSNKIFPKPLPSFSCVSLAWIWSSAHSPLNSCYWNVLYWSAWALIPQSISNKGLGTPWLALTTRIIPQTVICPRNHVSAMQPGDGTPQTKAGMLSGKSWHWIETTQVINNVSTNSSCKLLYQLKERKEVLS